MKKKKIKVTDWKLDDYLTTDRAMVAFLENIMKDNDPELLMSAIRDVIRIRGVASFAKKTKINEAKLYKILSRGSKIDVPTFLSFIDMFNLTLKPVLKKVA